jgi:enoyl-CoA hydratase/carnithine racemase
VSLGKPVVCALNGPALGSGCELAYACSARIAPRGIPSLFSHPEVRLGLIPGAGGTQRLIRLIDAASAWKLLRTGGSIGSAEALRLGLLLEEVDGDLIERAKALARKIQPAPLPSTRPHADLPEVDLAGLSRKIDEILRKAILKGAAMPLEKALEFEAECFGEVFATKDCRIGLENYFRTRLREPARFVHA